MGAESGANKIVFFYFDFLLNFDCENEIVEGRGSPASQANVR